MSDGREIERIESLLLDLHLNQLQAEQAQEVEDAIASSPELARKSKVLREVLGLLDDYQLPEPSVDLSERVMSRIDEQTSPLPFPDADSAIPAGTAQDLSASPILSLRELVTIAACITLFVSICVPGYFKVQNLARRKYCGSNLQQIWNGMASYAQANNGYIAYAGHVPGGSWLPWHQSRTPGVRRASNTRPLFKLLQGQYVREARIFICPADPHGRPMLADSYKTFSDFAEPANNSYSFQYMNLPQGRLLNRINIRMVLVADRNPLFDGRTAGQNLSPYQEDKTNSLIHEKGAGQNAMYADGRGGWHTEPTIGVNGDNIYRAGQLIRYHGTEKPSSDDDSMLVP
ncbi:MAG: hypothetical protein JSV03_12195 [Planctomycetota bacterium]|nr:MAG: hypothetical protein JSV03_12195 [Planctomycetota bacterium]